MVFRKFTSIFNPAACPGPGLLLTWLSSVGRQRSRKRHWKIPGRAGRLRVLAYYYVSWSVDEIRFGDAQPCKPIGMKYIAANMDDDPIALFTFKYRSKCWWNHPVGQKSANLSVSGSERTSHHRENSRTWRVHNPRCIGSHWSGPQTTWCRTKTSSGSFRSESFGTYCNPSIGPFHVPALPRLHSSHMHSSTWSVVQDRPRLRNWEWSLVSMFLLIKFNSPAGASLQKSSESEIVMEVFPVQRKS